MMTLQQRCLNGEIEVCPSDYFCAENTINLASCEDNSAMNQKCPKMCVPGECTGRGFFQNQKSQGGNLYTSVCCKATTGVVEPTLEQDAFNGDSTVALTDQNGNGDVDPMDYCTLNDCPSSSCDGGEYFNEGSCAYCPNGFWW